MKSKSLAEMFTLLFIAAFMSVPTHAVPLDTWHLRNPFATTASLNKVTYGNGAFVAVGSGGVIVTSTNGTNWVAQDSGADWDFSFVAFGNGVFVAMGNYPFVLTSTNLVDWSLPANIPANYIVSLSFLNGLFVAVQSSEVIATSSDGLHWDARSVDPGISLRTATYVNGTFFAYGYSSSALASSDAINWSVVTISSPFTFRSINVGNGVAVGFGDTRGVLISSEGLSWITHPLPHDDSLRSLTFGNGMFLGFLYYDPTIYPHAAVVTSSDGINWSSSPSVVPADPISDLTYGNGLFVAVGRNASIYVSPNGTNWTDVSAFTHADLNDVTYANNLFAAVGSKGTVLTSSLGDRWSVRQSNTTNDLDSITYGKGLYVAAGDLGTILISDDATNWTSIASGVPSRLWVVGYGNGLFIAAGENGTIVTSANGFFWTRRNSGTTRNLKSISYGNGIFAVVSEAFGAPLAEVISSRNGVDWENRQIPVSGSGAYAAVPITFANGTFISPGSGLVKSTNAVDWMNNLDQALPFGPSRLLYADGLFVAIGFGVDGEIASSQDLKSWNINAFLDTGAYSTFPYTGPGIAFGNGTFVIVGGSGAIWQSDPVSGPAPIIVQQPHSQTTSAGASVTFTASVVGNSPLWLQWQKNGNPIMNAANASLTLANVQPTDAGTYVLVASNAFGMVTTSPASLNVTTIDGVAQLSIGLYAGLSMEGMLGRSYRIEYAENLVQPDNWQPLEEIVLLTSPYLWFDRQPVHGKARFYRAVLLPP